MFFSNMLHRIRTHRNQQVAATTNTNITEYNQQLIAAIQAADVAGVKLALEKGADPNACGDRQQPAIVMASGSKTNSAELVHALISHSDIPLDLDQRSQLQGGWTALMTAVSTCKNIEAVNLLLEEGANTTLKHKGKSTAADIAYMRCMNELREKIQQFTKLKITPKLLNKQAKKTGIFFAETKYNDTNENKKLYPSTRQLPEEVIILIGSFLYSKSRLKNHFIPGMIAGKEKIIKTNKMSIH